jgi:hypothetical protein
VATNKFIIDVAGEIFEAICWESSELLAGMVSLWIKFITSG